MVKATADAGFNVFFPRIGHERWTGTASGGMVQPARHLPHALDARVPDRTRTPRPTEAGRLGGWHRQPLVPTRTPFGTGPPAILWRYAHQLELPALMGVFLDINYAQEDKASLYSLSYDDTLFWPNFEAGNFELPLLRGRTQGGSRRKVSTKPSRSSGKPVAQRCRASVKRWTPCPRFSILRVPGPEYAVHGSAGNLPGMGYGPGAPDSGRCIHLRQAFPFPSEQESWKGNKARLLENMKIPARVSVYYAGGIDPCVRGAGRIFRKERRHDFRGDRRLLVFMKVPNTPNRTMRSTGEWFTWANKAIKKAASTLIPSAARTRKTGCRGI